MKTLEKSVKYVQSFIVKTLKTPKWRHWHRSEIFIGNFERISHLVLVLLLLTLGRWMPAGRINPFRANVISFNPLMHNVPKWSDTLQKSCSKFCKTFEILLTSVSDHFGTLCIKGLMKYLQHWNGLCWVNSSYCFFYLSQPAFICSKLTIETPEEGVKCVQS